MSLQTVLNRGQKMGTAFTGSPASYGLTVLQATIFTGAVTTLQEKVADLADAEAAYHAAVQAKNAAMDAVTTSMVQLAAIVYATPTITDEQLADAGLAIRSKPGKITPTTPLALTAVPNTDGTVALKWKRNGNPQGVMFTISVSDDSETWSNIAVTQAARFTLAGYKAGVQKYFCVTATTRGVNSPASLPVIIYPSPSSAIELHVAA